MAENEPTKYMTAYIDESNRLIVKFRTPEETSLFMKDWNPINPAVIVPSTVPEDFLNQITNMMSIEFIKNMDMK